ncbi:MAG: HNH endonuclease signature motif containing protein, partial [Actinomycetota bacterium]
LGPTDMDNLIPVCEHHHHQLHEGGWQLTMTPERVTTWTRPDGTIYWTGSTIDRHQPAASLDPAPDAAPAVEPRRSARRSRAPTLE